MRKEKSFFLAISVLALLGVSYLQSCSKNDDNENSPSPSAVVCIVKGRYLGTSTIPNLPSKPMAYTLGDDNFIYGGENLTSEAKAFGSYSNTCDSIKMRSWYSVNGQYYYFEGKFSNNRSTITGVYKNLSVTSEVGTFTLTKQP